MSSKKNLTAVAEGPSFSRDLKEEQDEQAQQSSIAVLVELIGARNLLVDNENDALSLEPFCKVQFGPRTIHKTKTSKTNNPIWTITNNSLFVVNVTQNDIANKKKLKLTVWSRCSSSTFLSAAAKVVHGTKKVQFEGKAMITCDQILANYCNEERIMLDLKDEMNRDIQHSQEPTPTLALRFRIATPDDVRFVQTWQQYGKLDYTTLKESGIMETTMQRPVASIVSEQDESEVMGAAFMTTLYNNITAPRYAVEVKPHADPSRPQSTTYMKPNALKRETRKPSSKWVEAGSGSLGRLFLEVLSCHDLPNVDVGQTVGNLTDSFCCIVYEDAAVETPVIDDELSPHWPPWTQRAFLFHMMHPSSVLYLAVFHYKRGGMLNHRPIGRVEINTGNLQRDTVYNLRYSLSPSSHVTERESCGTIRVRLRMEIHDEKAALLAALKSPLPIYINVEKQKSFPVVRYTCRGEYDAEDKFDLSVLKSYYQELRERYMAGMAYSISDSIQSLIYWRPQVKVGRVWLPVHSFILFCMANTLVEWPRMFPALIPLTVAWIMLATMYQRLQQPSPWDQCRSFRHYFEILVRGQSPPAFERIRAGEGYEESVAKEEAWKSRLDKDRAFTQQTRQIKQLNKKDSMETSVKSMLDIEYLTILGKVQGGIGGICRFCRRIYIVVTWEDSALAFWITAVCLALGIIFSLLPWAFLLTWTGRIITWGFLGPHMKLIDLLRKSPDDKNIPEFLAERMFDARRKQEETTKLKSFRACRFGEYATRVPGNLWTPHCERPLAESDAQLMANSRWHHDYPVVRDDWPCIPGQQLYGKMIPRPEAECRRNLEDSMQEQERVAAMMLGSKRMIRPTIKKNVHARVSVPDQGVEVPLPSKKKYNQSSRRLSMFSIEVDDLQKEGQQLRQRKGKQSKPTRQELLDEFMASSVGFEVDDILVEESFSQEEGDENEDDENGATAGRVHGPTENNGSATEENSQQAPGNFDKEENISLMRGRNMGKDRFSSIGFEVGHVLDDLQTETELETHHELEDSDNDDSSPCEGESKFDLHNQLTAQTESSAESVEVIAARDESQDSPGLSDLGFEVDDILNEKES